MAKPALRLPQNVDGDLYVDSTCIDCDTCRQLAPGVYGRADEAEASFVQRQPRTPEERERALMALVACPTASIGTLTKADTAAAARRFPVEMAEDLYFCGFTAESSFGAWSWLLRRPDGNVLVDSPRAATGLLDRIEALGGVRWLFLTHADDVADHGKLRRRFGCERILHRADVAPGTEDVERLLDGTDPVDLAADLTIVPVPGHTAGSAVLLWRERDLFSGDHVWANDDGTGLAASRSVCWYSWEEQTRSMERLLSYRFERVFPGHGPVYRARSPDEAHAALEALVRRMRARR
jgi:glyoxylase-like metal-dependent hydrolase (beta-lactamase superfamily II)/ferredoxin